MGFKKNNPGCQCCGGGTSYECPYCSGTIPATRTATFDGYSDGVSCDCDPFNAAFVCDYDEYNSIGNYCQWNTTGTIDCGGSSVNYEVRIRIQYTSILGVDNLRWNVFLIITGSSVDERLEVQYSTPYSPISTTDCTASASPIYVTHTDSACADPSSTTCAIS